MKDLITLHVLWVTYGVQLVLAASTVCGSQDILGAGTGWYRVLLDVGLISVIGYYVLISRALRGLQGPRGTCR